MSIDPSFNRLEGNTPASQQKSINSIAITSTEEEQTTVQISGKALTLSAQSTSTLDVSGLPPFIGENLYQMLTNPDFDGMGAVRDLVNGPDGVLVNISDPNNITYTGSGQPVTAASTAAFNKMSAELLPQKQAIMQQGMANGDSPVQIYLNLAVFMLQQPTEYLHEMDWYGSADSGSS